MKLLLRSLLVLLAGLSIEVHAQVLLSDSLLVTYTIEELIAEGIADPENPIEVHRLRYATTDPFGQPTMASGAVVLPIAPGCHHAMAAYMHGTILDREDVPSRLSSEIIVGYFLGASGYVGVLPDYLGLGDGPGRHPYIHAASEATASIDMLRATREFCALRNVQLNGQLFLVGYSQGGHACMATHKMIEEQFAEEFQVTASAPCSGPYDASGVQAAVITDTIPYPAPYYLPYVLFSYQYVYPWLFDTVNEVLQEPWATVLPPLFLGNNGSGVVDDVMPVVPSEILQDSVLQAFRTNPEHPFRIALRENDLYNWAPIAPVRMLYCEGDGHVFYQNSIVALDTMVSLGSTTVSAQNIGSALDHSDCAFPALLSAKGWFDSLQWPCEFIGMVERAGTAWSLFPNPAQDLLHIQVSNGHDGMEQWTMLHADGRAITSGRMYISSGSAKIDLPEAPPGVYVLLLGDQGGITALRFVLE